MDSPEKAPREVWLNADQIEGRRFNVVFMQVMAPTAGSDQMVRYVRADLVPSVPPVGERESRISQALILLQQEGDCRCEDGSPDCPRCAFIAKATTEAHAVLSSPAPDPASEPRADPFFELLAELMNITNAKRFDGAAFEDDTSFANWAQSRAQAAIQNAGYSVATRLSLSLGLQVKE